MVLWNLPDGGPSHSGPLIGPSECMQGDTLGTIPRHGPQKLIVYLYPNGFEHETVKMARVDQRL
jgi:hypothetical protein